MKLPSTFRPFAKEDWYGLAGASALADGSGPFIGSIQITHEDCTEQVEVVVSGTSVPDGNQAKKVEVQIVLAQGEPLSMRLDESQEPVGAAGLSRDLLTVNQAEALLKVLAASPTPIEVDALLAMGFATL